MNMMTAVAAAPAIALPATAFAAPAGRRAWNRALAEYERAKARCEQSSARHDRATEAYDAARRAVPHVVLGPDPYSGAGRVATTADGQLVKHARYSVRDLDAGRLKLDPIPNLQEHYRLMRELATAANDRDAQLEAIDLRVGYTAAEEAWEAALDVMDDALDHLVQNVRAPDLAAVIKKMELLSERHAGFDWAEASGEAILKDLKRLQQN